MQIPSRQSFETPQFLNFTSPKNSSTTLQHPYSSSRDDPTKRYNIEPKSMFAFRAGGNGVRSAARLLRSERQQVLGHYRNASRPLSTPTVLKRKPEQKQQDESPVEKVDKQKTPARKTSLRRVGLEAERSRVVVRHRGGMRTIERGVETKVGGTKAL